MSRDIIHLGDTVACDRCNQDSNKSGGILFSGNAYCPECTEHVLKIIKRYKEERYITARCPEGKSFHDWVVKDLRGGEPGTIEIVTGKDFDDEIKKRGI